jgi:hypothetical protein
MLYPLKNLFHRPAIRMGRVDNSIIQTTRLRNAQFVSFMSQSDSLAPMSLDRYDTKLRRRRRYKTVLIFGMIAGLAWVILESAHAISMF